MVSDKQQTPLCLIKPPEGFGPRSTHLERGASNFRFSIFDFRFSISEASGRPFDFVQGKLRDGATKGRREKGTGRGLLDLETQGDRQCRPFAFGEA